MREKHMIVSQAIEKMIAFYKGSIHDIDHFIKVWAYAKTIGELEGLDAHTQEVLELAAVIHDIACPLCREKYGKALGKLQEQESHHTYTDVDGLDHRILLEADYIVNAAENSRPRAATESAKKTVFRTASGTRLLDSIFHN